MKFLVLVVSFFLFPGCMVFADKFYVSAAAPEGGNGKSWETAYRYLQDALEQTAAGRNDEIWIAAGTYYPDEGANATEGDREASFTMSEDVTLYGGFSGYETNLSERDWIANVTTLSGEIYEEPEFWSLHVCTILWVNGLSNILNYDGLTITRGNANGMGANSRSAALFTFESVNVRIKARNCIFSEHRAESAAVSVGGRWDVAQCIFKNNTGGVASVGRWLVEDCTFTENTSEEGGVAFKGEWTVNNSAFSRNSASWRGGVASQGKWSVTNSSFTENFTFGERLGTGYGVFAQMIPNVTSCEFSKNSGDYSGVGGGRFTSCIFTENSAIRTGGVNGEGGDSIVFTDCNFFRNNAGSGGVGMGVFINCNFIENFADNGGITSYGTNTFIRCVFKDNYALSKGGVFSSGDQGIVSIASCAFEGNSAPVGGVSSGAKCSVFNSIFVGNSATEKGGVADGGTWNIHSSSLFGNSAPLGSIAHNSNWKLTNSILMGINKFESMIGFSNASPPDFPTPIIPRVNNLIEGGALEIKMTEGIDANIGTGYILDFDPLFSDSLDPNGEDDIWFTSDDGLRLQEDSPAIGAGDIAFLPTDRLDMDKDGDPLELLPLDAADFTRIQGGTLDLGAYEFGDDKTPVYSLTVSTGAGGSSNYDGSNEFFEITQVEVTVTVQNGYLFDSWSGDASGSENPLTIDLTSDMSVVANILQDTSDSDLDGLSAYQEYQVYGTNPNLADTDGDNIKDGDEVGTIFDPNVDDTSAIQLIAANPETFLDLVSATDGIHPEILISRNESGDFLVKIRVEATVDLRNWQALDLAEADIEGDTLTLVVPLSESAKFLRILGSKKSP